MTYTTLSRTFLAGAMLALSALPAAADWSYRLQEVQSGPPLHLAMSFNETGAVALRCHEDLLDFMYVTANRPLFDVLVEKEGQADGTFVLYYDGEATRWPVEGILRRDGGASILAAIDPETAIGLSTVGRSVDVAVEIEGVSYAETRFQATGSIFAVFDVQDNCPNPAF